MVWDEIESLYNSVQSLGFAEANRALIAANVSRKKRKEKVDKTAAAIILQGYLDSLL